MKLFLIVSLLCINNGSPSPDTTKKGDPKKLPGTTKPAPKKAPKTPMPFYPSPLLFDLL